MTATIATLIATLPTDSNTRPPSGRSASLTIGAQRQTGDLGPADQHQPEQRLAALLGHGVTVIDLDFPYVVEAALECDEGLRRTPQRGCEPEDQHPHAAIERCRIGLQLRSQHRDVVEGAVDDPLLQLLVVLQDEAEDRRGRQQEREDRQEAEEGHHRCVASGDVTSPAVERVDAHLDRGVLRSQIHHPFTGGPRHDLHPPRIGQIPVDRLAARPQRAPRWRG